MNPQTQSRSMDQDPGTPVIVKNGGNVDELSISIESESMPFNELIPGPTWVVSQSTFRRRIEELQIKEAGSESHYSRKTTQLISITIEFEDDGGEAQLLVLESGNPDTNEIALVIVSVGVAFNVKTPGEWETSQARLPPIKRVVFREGIDLIVDHPFTGNDIRLEIWHQILS